MYGINVWDEQFMASTPWPMLRSRILRTPTVRALTAAAGSPPPVP